MLLIRCKNFHNDGSVKKICIEGSSCPYIHPSHPEWEKSVPISSDGNRSADKAEFRKAYRKMIRYTEDAVRIQIELDAAKENLFRWKNTQSSKIYAHTGPKTRQILDTQRKDYALTVSTLEKQRSRTLSVLSELSSGHKFGALPSDNDELQAYIDELNQWIESLCHLLPTSESASPDIEDPSQWTWGQIEASAVVLNDLCAKYVELSLIERYTNIEPEAEGPDNDTMRQSAGAIRGKDPNRLVHGVNAKEVSNLQQRIARDGEELVQLRAKLQDLEDIQTQMQKRLEVYTQWAEEDTARIQALSERIKLLYKLPNPAVQPPDGVLEATSKFVAGEAEEIVAAYFNTLVSLCVQNNNDLLEELDVRLLRSIKQVTQVIYEHARVAEASGVR